MSVTDPQHKGHEPDNLAVRSVLGLAGILLAGLLIVFAAAYGLVSWYEHITPGATRGTETPSVAVPMPHLQVYPQLDLAAQRAAKQHLLQEYAWIDRPAGRVRIPIDRAMELMLQRDQQSRGES